MKGGTWEEREREMSREVGLFSKGNVRKVGRSVLCFPLFFFLFLDGVRIRLHYDQMVV